MTQKNSNIDLDRLKAVSPALADVLPRVIEVGRDYWEAIAADILRLAEEAEKAYHEGYDQGVTGQPRRKRLTPASAGGGKADR